VLLVALVLLVAILAIIVLRDSVRTSIANRAPSRSSAAGGGGTMLPDETAAVARTVGPAVVVLEVSVGGGGHRSATGLVLTPAGEVVTNNHVIAAATAITARVGGTGRTYAARVLGYDVTDDVAVLGLVDASGLSIVEPRDSSALAGGDPVAVIGSDAGAEGAAKPRTGAVAGLDRVVRAGAETLRGMVEIDVATRASDSGGAVANAGGRVVAMTTAAPAGDRFHEQTNGDVTFAIPMEDVLAVVDRVDAGHSTDTVHVGPTAALGVAVRPTSPHGGAGAYVVSVESDGPAGHAGLVADTIVVSIDDTTIATTGALETTLDRHRPGDVVRVGWVGRDGSYEAANVELGSGPPP
jgi:S1-C subfamily serine protease